MGAPVGGSAAPRAVATVTSSEMIAAAMITAALDARASPRQLGAIAAACIRSVSSNFDGELAGRLAVIGEELRSREVISEIAAEEFTHAQPALQWLHHKDEQAAKLYGQEVKLRNVAAHQRRGGARRRQRGGIATTDTDDPSSGSAAHMSSTGDEGSGKVVAGLRRPLVFRNVAGVQADVTTANATSQTVMSSNSAVTQTTILVDAYTSAPTADEIAEMSKNALLNATSAKIRRLLGEGSS